MWFSICSTRFVITYEGRNPETGWLRSFFESIFVFQIVTYTAQSTGFDNREQLDNATRNHTFTDLTSGETYTIEIWTVSSNTRSSANSVTGTTSKPMICNQEAVLFNPRTPITLSTCPI